MEEVQKRPGVAALPLRPARVVLLHWLTVLTLLIAITAIWTRAEVEGRALRAGLLWLHEGCGLAVLLLALTRVFARMRLGRLPALAEGRLSQAAAAAVHGALYLGMLAVPVVGFVYAAAAGRLLPGVPEWMTAALPDDPDLADRLGDGHQTAAYVWLALIALHVGAALWHHFILRDGVLQAMRLRRAVASKEK